MEHTKKQIETKNIIEVLDHAKGEDTLVIFDVDNTLVHTGQEIGTEAWAHWMVEQRLMEGVSPQEALEYIFALFGYVHDHIDVVPVEQEAVDVLNTLKNQSVSTIVLTGRPSFMVSRTEQQLARVGMTLNSPEVFKTDNTLQMMCPVILSNGVICGGINNKGDVLSNIFKILNFRLPRSIVFVDDKQSCVDSVGAVCDFAGINFMGIRYGYMDNATFNPQRACEELEILLLKYVFTTDNKINRRHSPKSL